MTKPPEWALREAAELLVIIGKAHGREVHGRYYEDNKAAMRATALALATARRRGIEEAANALLEAATYAAEDDAGIMHADANFIRALASKEPPMTAGIEDLRKQVLELEEALQLTKASKEDALARATAENQKLRDELVGKRDSWYTRFLEMQMERDRLARQLVNEENAYLVFRSDADKANDRATKAVEALGIARRHLVVQGTSHPVVRSIDAALASIKELLEP